MNPLLLTSCLLFPALVSGEPPVSDQVGVYGIVEKVVFKPSAEDPRGVEIWGAFAVAEGPHGDYYKAPVWGYLSFVAKPDKEGECVTQWRDLAEVAGTGQCVGFSFRYAQEGVRVWTTADPAPEAAVFEPAMGVQTIDNADYGPIRMLRHLPRPVAPTGAAAVAPSEDERRPALSIVLECEPCLADAGDCRYVFELRRKDGETLGSRPIAAADGSVRWKLETALQPGEQAEWSVRVLLDGLDPAPIAREHFGATTQARRDG